MQDGAQADWSPTPAALTDLERCFKICFLMIPAMVPRQEAPRSCWSSQPPHAAAVSSLSGLTRPEERRLSAHPRRDSRPRPRPTAAAAAAAENPEHDAQAAAAAAGAILAAASPKRPGEGGGGAAGSG